MERRTTTIIGLVLVVVVVIGGVALYLSMAPPAPAPPELNVGYEAGRGGPAEKIYVTVRTTQEGGVADVANGQLDAFLWPVSGGTLVGLPTDVLENIKPIRASTGYWSLIFNPVYNRTAAAEYNVSVWPIITVETEEVFNPWAIREMRYWMNWLIDRQFIINRILYGFGEPMYSPVMLSEPSGPQFYDVYDEIGLTQSGDKMLAIQKMNETMTAWANLVNTKLGSTVVTFEADSGANVVGGWWKFKGDYITFDFYIRIEDERHEEGLHVADLIEDAGIKVNRVETDRRTCVLTVYLTDPADWEWGMYTEGWVSMTSYKYVEWSVAQMYAPWVGWMPGLQVGEWWNYENSTLDQVTMDSIFYVTDEEGYWDDLKTAVKMGIQESIRVFVAAQYEYFTVNKDTVKEFAYDIGGGMWSRWALSTMNSTDGVLTIAEYSSAAALFMSAWNPIGGLDDVYSHLVWDIVVDPGTYTHPLTGEPIPVRANWTSIEKGTFSVGETVVRYNSTSDTWQSATDYGATGAKVKVTFKFNFGKWHHGIMMDMNDIRYWIGFMYEWSTQDGPEDPFYDEAYAASAGPWLDTIVGFEFVDDNTLVVYGNYSHPISDSVTGEYYSVWASLPWEVGEAMAWTVAYGVGENEYSWDGSVGEWLDLLSTAHCDDMVTWFDNFTAEHYIPGPLTGYVTQSDADDRYATAKLFYDTYGHLVIGNGPYFIYDYDPDAMFIELHSFRDPTYPFMGDYWLNQFQFHAPQITDYTVPTTVNVTTAGDLSQDLVVNVTVEVAGAPVANYTVKVIVRNSTGFIVFVDEAKTDEDGKVSITFTDSDKLAPVLEGTYTVEIRAYETEASVPTTLFTAFAAVVP
ncbi:MAG: hypothetical protein ACP6IQ_07735 [Candidatus Njordarchaeia archaeon]